MLAIEPEGWYALGAVLAGVGSLLGGIAAIWIASRKAKEDDKKTPTVPPDGR